MSSAGGTAAPAVTYLWRDLFTTNRAAGAVVGTAAEPGVETRLGRDAGNIISIADGKLEFATGGNLYTSNGEARLDYGVQTRANGVALYGRITPNGGDCFLAWSQSNDLADYTQIRHSFYLTGGNINYYNGSGSTTLAAYTNGVTYDVLLILRATGCYLYTKTAAETEWTLRHTDNSNAVALMTPGFTKGGVGTFSLDEIALIDLGADWTTSDPLPAL